jgi:hypothetical protein
MDEDDLIAEIAYLQAEQEACTKALNEAMQRRGVFQSKRATVGKTDLTELRMKVAVGEAKAETLEAVGQVVDIALRTLMDGLRPVLEGYKARIEQLEQNK